MTTYEFTNFDNQFFYVWVEVSYYNENDLDESIVWTQSDDVGRGYQCIHLVGNIHLNLDSNLVDGK